MTEAEEARIDALAKALRLLDFAADEGFHYDAGDGQVLDAADVCTDLCEEYGIEPEPGWWRIIPALSRPVQQTQVAGEAEVTRADRDALIALHHHKVAPIIADHLEISLERSRTDGGGWVTTGHESCAVIDAARSVIAYCLALPAALTPQVAGEADRSTQLEEVAAAADAVFPIIIEMFEAFPYAEKSGDDEKVTRLRQALRALAALSPDHGMGDGQVGASLRATCSRPSDQAPLGLDAPRVDQAQGGR